MLTREAVEIYSFQQLEEFNSVLWVLGEVFVDHLESTLKDIFHDGRHFVFHQVLQDISIIFC